MIYVIMIKDFMLTLRDKKALALMLLMPLALIFFLGMGLSFTFDEDNSIEKFTVGVVNEDEGIYSSIFINEFLRSEDIGELFETFIVTEDKANQMLEENIVPAIIRVPKNYSANLEQNKAVIIKVIKNSERSITPEIVSSVVEGYMTGFGVIKSSAQIINSALEEAGVTLESPGPGFSPEITIMTELARDMDSSMINFIEMNQEKDRWITSMQYYSAGMLAMYILLGAITGIKTLLTERSQQTLARMLCTRASRSTIILGKFLSLVTIGMVQSLIIIGFTYLFIGVYWGSSVLTILLLTFCNVFAGAAGGMLIASISKTAKAADGMGSLMVQVMSLLGGSMIPVYVFPESLQIINKLTINSWSIKGFISLMTGGTLESIVVNCFVLVGMGIAFLTIGVATFKMDVA